MQSKSDEITLHLPLLEGLLRAEEQERQAVVGSRLAVIADNLLEVASSFPGCVVWPVGRAAERVVGAVAVRGGDAVEVAAWGTSVAGREVLLVDISGVSALSMSAVSVDLRSRGAAAVHACAVAVVGADACPEFDSFTSLAAPSGAPFELRAA